MLHLIPCPRAADVTSVTDVTSDTRTLSSRGRRDQLLDTGARPQPTELHFRQPRHVDAFRRYFVATSSLFCRYFERFSLAWNECGTSVEQVWESS